VIQGLENPRPKIDQSVFPKILAIVLFGDSGFKITASSTDAANSSNSPEIPVPLMSKVKQNCNPGDPVTSYSWPQLYHKA
jgi:hypothetical protein